MDIIYDSFINDINLSICIFPADTLHNEELSKRMVEFTKFYSFRINEISDKTIDVFESESIYKSLEENHEKYDHILFMAAGVRIFDSSIIFDIKNEILKNPNYMAAGHILEWKELWYELHHQFILVNTKNWVKAGKPEYGGWEHKEDDLVVIERSEENFHDDYTPLWIKNTSKIENRFHQKQGWNFINEALKNGFDIINWNQTIRDKRTYYYPESNTERFLECLKTQTVDNSLNVNQVKLLQTPNSVRNQIWLLNSEDMNLTYGYKNDKFDTIAVPAGGFKFLDALKSNHLKEGGKLIIYDFNKKSLEWIDLIYKSDIRDIKVLIQQFPDNNFFHFLGMGQKVFGMEGRFTNNFLSSLGRTFDYFGGENFFYEFLDKFRTLDVELMHIDLIQNPKSLLDKINGQKNYISISNIYCTDFTNAFIGLSKIEEKYNEFIHNLPNNTVLVGFDPMCSFIDRLYFNEQTIKLKEQITPVTITKKLI